MRSVFTLSDAEDGATLEADFESDSNYVYFTARREDQGDDDGTVVGVDVAEFFAMADVLYAAAHDDDYTEPSYSDHPVAVSE